MKFSCDGKYLANSGEDGVVRVWKVIEGKRSRLRRDYLNEVNDISQLKPVLLDEEKPNKTTESFKKTSESSCVVFPPKVYRIMEKPLYEFKGHMGEVLDISWSKDNSLLSTSMDKTVRLRKVGSNACRGVCPHNSYVTSVQFNPVNENYFMSGSIDGKVRIWNISGCNFVDWELFIREEICPPISLPLIIRILCNFTPDEFCPDHVPRVVIEELNSAEKNGNEKLSEEDFPYAASSVSYMPPSTMDVAEKVAEAVGKLSRNVSMIQRKGYTSDEELEELDSLLTSKKFGCGCHLKRKKKLECWP